MESASFFTPLQKHDFLWFSCSGEESDLETEEDPLQLRGGEAAASDSGEDR